ncbi:MAG: hypothetical protein R2909_08145 [Gemmatimonadales bacterium]
MTIYYFDLMWGVALFVVAGFTACCVVFNPAVRSVRTMGIVASYAVGAMMLAALPLAVAVATWCLFAGAGGLVALGYELWARRRYAGSGRRPRPLVLLQGFLLWPAMVPEAIEGALVDLGMLEPSGPDGEEKELLRDRARAPEAAGNR